MNSFFVQDLLLIIFVLLLREEGMNQTVVEESAEDSERGYPENKHGRRRRSGNACEKYDHVHTDGLYVFESDYENNHRCYERAYKIKVFEHFCEC